MVLDILGRLAKFKQLHDLEYERIIYRTRIPHRAPLAYFTVVFKPVSMELLGQRVRELRMPPSLREWYLSCNGGVLYGGVLRLYGLRPDRYVLDRANWMREAWPVDILEANGEHQGALDALDAVCFGDYSADHSLLCVCRETQVVTCFEGRMFGRVRRNWRSIDEWLTEETSRLSGCFDENGIRLVDEHQLVPPLVQ
jgi:hypothetical protein